MSYTKAEQATSMPSPESNSVNVESWTSSEITKLTREEGRALIEECEEFGKRFMQYLKDNNMLPKPCPAPKIK